MKNTLRRICELQTSYSSENTTEMKERGILIRRTLVQELKNRRDQLAPALGRFAEDFSVEGSDGIGRKTQLPWVRLYSASMSPSATEGFYVVMHFSTDGSGVNIAVGCSSSKFKNGSNITLPPKEIDERCSWARKIISEHKEKIYSFTDSNSFGSTARLPQSFERACALVKKIPFTDIRDNLVEHYLFEALEMLRLIYEAQRQGRELSPADQVEIEIIDATRPIASLRRGQGFGLTSSERRAVEQRAMDLSETWLTGQGYTVKNTAATKPYDFEAEKAGEMIFVEVKGTTSDVANAMVMTHGEVNLHQKHKGRTALMLVYGINLTRISDTPCASGGTLEPLLYWDIDTWTLTPIAFRLIQKTS